MDDFCHALFTKVGQMFAILAPIAYIFIVVGLWTSISGSGRSASNYLKAIVKVAIFALVLSQFISWIGMFEDSVQSLVYGTLNANPAAVYEKYKILAGDPSNGETGGFWHSIFQVSQRGSSRRPSQRFFGRLSLSRKSRSISLTSFTRLHWRI